MKIAIDGRSIKEKPSGVGIWNLRFIHHLLRESSHTIYLLLPKNCTYNFANDSFFSQYIDKRLHLIPTPFTYSFVDFKRFFFEQFGLIKLLVSLNVDIYHATDSFGLPFLLPAYIKTVITCHDMIPYTPYREYMNGMQFLFYNAAIKISLKKATRVIAISDQTRDDILTYTHTGKEISVIYNGIDKLKKLPEDTQKTQWEEISEIHNLSSENYIFYFGGFGPRKNVLSVVETFLYLRKNKLIKKDCKLILCGRITNAKKASLESLQSINELIKKYSIAQSVIILDYISEETKLVLIQNALLCLFFYLYEGFGFAPIEVLQQNKLVVFTKTGIWQSYKQENILIVENPLDSHEMNEKVALVLKEKKEIQHRALTMLQQFIQQFSWSKMTQEYLEVYKNL